MRVWTLVQAMVLSSLALTPTVDAATAGGSSPPVPELVPYAEAAKPADGHRHLDHLIGRFDTQITSWMLPDKPPMVSKGVMEGRWILGGRYVETIYKGDFMGTTIEGRSIDGYDTVAGEFVSSWIDSWNTGIMFMMGKGSPDGKVRHGEGYVWDPVAGKTRWRQIMNVVDADTHRLDFYIVDAAGQAAKVMEVLCRRLPG
jgi:Protein of unknown function (DUF1579)